ncbi:MAG: uroporphyrinogen-III synthase [Bacteroidaceae bacterium]
MELKKILVSQPKPASDKSPYFSFAEENKVDVVFRPLIKVVSVSTKEFRQQKVSILDYTAVVFTSRHAVDHFFMLSKALRIDLPDDMKYFCVSEAVALYIQKYVQYRKRKVFFGNTGRIDGLRQTITKHDKDSYFVPMSDVHKDDMRLLLEDVGVKYALAVMYKTVDADFEEGEKLDSDMIILFSPSGLRCLLNNFPDFANLHLKIATFGAATAQAVKEAGLDITVEAPTVEAPSMVAALQLYVKQLKKAHKVKK